MRRVGQKVTRTDNILWRRDTAKFAVELFTLCSDGHVAVAVWSCFFDLRWSDSDRREPVGPVNGRNHSPTGWSTPCRLSYVSHSSQSFPNLPFLVFSNFPILLSAGFFCLLGPDEAKYAASVPCLPCLPPSTVPSLPSTSTFPMDRPQRLRHLIQPGDKDQLRLIHSVGQRPRRPARQRHAVLPPSRGPRLRHRLRRWTIFRYTIVKVRAKLVHVIFHYFVICKTALHYSSNFYNQSIFFGRLTCVRSGQVQCFNTMFQYFYDSYHWSQIIHSQSIPQYFKTSSIMFQYDVPIF